MMSMMSMVSMSRGESVACGIIPPAVFFYIINPFAQFVATPRGPIGNINRNFHGTIRARAMFPKRPMRMQYARGGGAGSPKAPLPPPGRRRLPPRAPAGTLVGAPYAPSADEAGREYQEYDDDDGGGGGGDDRGGDYDYDYDYGGEGYEEGYGGKGGGAQGEVWVWIAAGAILFVFALAAAALGLSIWSVLAASSANRRLDDAKESGLLLREAPTQRGHTPQWDPDQRAWFPGHASVRALEDVRLGSDERPLEEGDILRWERGRLVNARDRALEQELGHHLDTRFVRPQTGDVPLYNGNSSQWRNVPLGAMLAIRALGDVEFAGPGGAPRDGATLRYNAKRGKWVERSEAARAWLRFCAPPEGANTYEVNRTWGALEQPLAPGRWTPIRPVSPFIGIYTMDLHTQGGLRASRKNAALITRRHNDHHGMRPSAGGGATGAAPLYLMRAIVAAGGFPAPGAWGFLVGNEPNPADGGFAAWPEWLGPHQDFPAAASGPAVHQWNVETVRRIGPDTPINLAYYQDKDAEPAHQPLIQCMMMSVEEL